MVTNDYTLEIISHHNDFRNKSLRQFYLDGINTIGVFGNESFEIKFKNKTYKKLQIKLTLDGTDILTGKKASLEPNEDMWVVNGYGELSVKAWPESHQGGAAFVFTHAENSVALHTHGDLSHKGIISAAVYEEGHVEPVRLNINHNHYNYPFYNPYIDRIFNKPWYENDRIRITCDSSSNDGRRSGNNVNMDLKNFGDCGENSLSKGTINTNYYSQDSVSKSSNNIDNSVMLCSAAVGAGEYVPQQIINVQGLIKPVFKDIVRVRYLWWDLVKAKLAEQNKPAPHATGFPASNQQIMNLGSTPRLTSKKSAVRRSDPMEFSRL